VLDGAMGTMIQELKLDEQGIAARRLRCLEPRTCAATTICSISAVPRRSAKST